MKGGKPVLPEPNQNRKLMLKQRGIFKNQRKFKQTNQPLFLGVTELAENVPTSLVVSNNDIRLLLVIILFVLSFFKKKILFIFF